MDGTSTQLSNELRQRLAEELGGWDKSLEPLAISILSASNACEFYDAERSVTAEMRSRADRMVKVLIAHRATDPEFVEPARARAHQ